MKKEFYISTDQSKLDIPMIHDYLSEQSYWAKGRSWELVEKSIQNSLCFGVFDGQNKQVAFARVATDYVVFAWLMDVFVVERLKGLGIGKMLIDYVIKHPELAEVNAIGLRTSDAHGLYEKFGFGSIPEPENWMFRKLK